MTGGGSSPAGQARVRPGRRSRARSRSRARRASRRARARAPEDRRTAQDGRRAHADGRCAGHQHLDGIGAARHAADADDRQVDRAAMSRTQRTASGLSAGPLIQP
jgi:hypothetical protein